MSKINFSFVAIFLLCFITTSCSKTNSMDEPSSVSIKNEENDNSIATKSSDKLLVDDMKSSIVNNAKNDIKNILNLADFNKLDWENFVFEKKENIQLTFFVKNNKSVSFVYFIIGQMKMYQWNGEVHLIN